MVLSYVGDSSDAQQSFADSGHAVAFQRPADMKSIAAIKLFAARYGNAEPPDEDFHVYLLDQNQKVLEQVCRSLRQDQEEAISAGTPSISPPSKCRRSF